MESRPVCRRRRDRHDHLGMGQDKRCRGLRQQRHPQAGRHSGVKAIDGKISLTVTDGKVTGWTGSGRNTYELATGSAASLAGKSTTYTAKSTGPGQFTMEVKVE